MTAPLDSLNRLVQGQTDRGRRHGGSRMRRVVLRFDVAEIARIDALRARFPKSSRAAIVRAFCLLGVDVAEERMEAITPLVEGSAP